jgi:para-aminobenzoate synthetase/4-amino-4-deoxychorismate lyase
MSSDVNLFHKTTRRDIYDRRRRRFPTVDDVVMVNERGECTETTTANLAVRRGPLWFTPPLSSGCLPGIAREIELERARIHEGVIQTSDLLVAEEIAVFNSLRGWRRAEIDVKVSHD